MGDVGLSGVAQCLSYHTSTSEPWSLGQLADATDWTPNGVMDTFYSYNRAGDREQVEYYTLFDMASYRYSDYVSLGLATSPTRAFQTMTKLESSNEWVATPEEFHYAYDGAGRILAAAFAQTPEEDYTPGTGERYYPIGSHPASSRARSVYAYDYGGRLTQVQTWWDTWYQSGYETEELVKNECDYELPGQGSLNRGLKTESRYYRRVNGDLSLVETQRYAYHNELDTLVGASYNAGTTWDRWEYDAAGNRARHSLNQVWESPSWSNYAYDNLNRMTDSPGCEYDNDILGNRTQRVNNGGEAGYAWDDAGRMTAYTVGGTIPGNPPTQVVPQTHAYTYRADGMRVTKISDSGVMYEPPEEFSGTWDEELAENLPTTRYGYDGQMVAMEDFTRYLGGSQLSVDKKRYALGARGIEMIESRAWDATAWSQAFPLYDGHGNMIATLARVEQTTQYQVSNLRSFDAWGGVRSGTSTGAPTQRYCASLGHVQDDESSLIYMRARYYEPSTGRFISEDRARDGANWFSYCDSTPTSGCDPSGKAFVELARFGAALGWFAYFSLTFFGGLIADGDVSTRRLLGGAISFLLGRATFSEGVFSALDRVARTIAKNGPYCINARSRASVYLEFWTGYGLFLAVALDWAANAADSWSPFDE